MTASMQVMADVEPDRRLYLGGSDAAAIMGVGAYGRTPLVCYRAKVGESVEVMDAEKRRFLERRKRWEGPIFEMLREEFDAEIVDDWPEPARLPPTVKQVRKKPSPTFTNRSMF